MPKKKLKIGLIGCGGNMRSAHVSRIKADGAADIVCVADPVKENAERLMEAWGSEVGHFADFRKMIRSEDLDAIIISSPHSMHYEQASYALRNKLHVLVEKPLTISPRHTKALLALSKKQKRIIDVSYQRHYYAPHQYARELVQTGAIGELRGLVAYVTQDWGSISGWRLVPEFSGGGMFMDTGSHLVAASLWISGLEPVEVSAIFDKADKNVDINGVVSVRFKGGAVGTLNTFGNARNHDERLAIHGSKGCIVFHLHQWELISVLVNNEPMEIPARIKESSPDAEFFKRIRNGGKGYEPPVFALQVAKLSEAAYKSWERRQPIRVAI